MKFMIILLSLQKLNISQSGFKEGDELEAGKSKKDSAGKDEEKEIKKEHNNL